VEVLIPHALKSIARLSVRPSSTAIVLVHGFKGDRNTTWANFQGLIDSPVASEWWSDCDLFFFAYSSVTQQVGITASSLETFISSVYPDLPEELLSCEIAGENISLPNRRYSSLILVGHSEGGLILRNLMLNRARRIVDAGRTGKKDVEHELQRDDILGSTLVLFAPAHLGRNISGLAALIPISILRLSNAYNNMSPSSDLVRSIREGTEALASKHKSLIGLIASSVFGTYENIVTVGVYATDWQYGTFAEKGHLSVCKPMPAFLDPLEFVRTAYDRNVKVQAGLPK
jgi:hypothetical protein